MSAFFDYIKRWLMAEGKIRAKKFAFYIVVLAFPILFFGVIECLAFAIILVADNARGFASIETTVCRYYIGSAFCSSNYFSGKTYLGNLTGGSPLWLKFDKPNPVLGWRYPADIAVRHNGWLYFTDANGFVDSLSPPTVIRRAKSPGVFRVVMLGGSTMIGQGAPTPDQNIVGMLRSLVHEHSIHGGNAGEQSLEIINAGVGGYSSAQEAVYLATELVEYNPDLVVVYDGWNDSSYNNAIVRDRGEAAIAARPIVGYTISDRLDQSYSLGGSLAIVFDNLQIAAQSIDLKRIAMADAVTRLLGLIPSPNLGLRSSAPRVETPYSPRSVEMYRSNWLTMIGVAQAHDMKIALFLQPLRWVDDRDPSDEEKSRGVDTMHLSERPARIAFYQDARPMLASLQKRYAPSSGVCAADLSKVFAGRSQESFYVDSGHLLPSGNAVIAAAILKQLGDCGFVH